MVSAVRKAHGPTDEVVVNIDRLSGEITASRNNEPIDMKELGRIAAQTAKQVMIQKIREAERGSIYEEFLERKGTVVTGTVSRFEGGALIVNLGRTEGFLPRSEQIPGETHHPGERIRCLILDVREAPHQVKIVLSRSHPDFIGRLFELEVPEVAERIIEQAKWSAEQEILKAKNSLRNQVVDMAGDMASGLVTNSMTPEDQKRLIEEYLEKVGKEH